jgi:hypothetical protein
MSDVGPHCASPASYAILRMGHQLHTFALVDQRSGSCPADGTISNWSSSVCAMPSGSSPALILVFRGPPTFADSASGRLLGLGGDVIHASGSARMRRNAPLSLLLLCLRLPTVASLPTAADRSPYRTADLSGHRKSADERPSFAERHRSQRHRWRANVRYRLRLAPRGLGPKLSKSERSDAKARIAMI